MGKNLTFLCILLISLIIFTGCNNQKIERENKFINVIKPEYNGSVNESFVIYGKANYKWLPEGFFYIELVDENNKVISTVPANSLIYPLILDKNEQIPFGAEVITKYNTDTRGFLVFKQYKYKNSKPDMSDYKMPIYFNKIYNLTTIKVLNYKDFIRTNEGIATWNYEKDAFELNTNNQKQIVISTRQEIPKNTKLFSFEYNFVPKNNSQGFIFEVFLNTERIYTAWFDDNLISNIDNSDYENILNQSETRIVKITNIKDFLEKEVDISFRLSDTNLEDNISGKIYIDNINFFDVS